jgi:hypothetical protein
MQDKEYEKILQSVSGKLSEHFSSVVILVTIDRDNDVAMARTRSGNSLTCLGHLKIATRDLEEELMDYDIDEDDDE